ncbi:MAG: zinc ribbon domain-containing protein [Promethearchaeota archaeon]
MANQEIYEEFYKYGKNMKLIAIFMIISLISFSSLIFLIIMLIFIVLGLQSLKIANYQLDSRDIAEYRSRLIISYIIKLISNSILLIGVISIIMAIRFSIDFGLGAPDPGAVIIYIIIPIATGISLTIISSIIEMSAWDSLMAFFEQYGKDLFPEELNRELIEGCEKLKAGARMYMIFFLILPLIIGYIFQIIGFFKLAKLDQLPRLMELNFKRKSPKSSLIKEYNKKFCPICGAEIKGNNKYCVECGSPIKEVFL